MHDLGSIWGHISSVAEELDSHRRATLRAFADHCGLVADALWTLKQLDDGRGTVEQLDEAIRTCLRPGAELAILTADAKRLIAELQRCLEETHEQGTRQSNAIAAGADHGGPRAEAGREGEGCASG